MLSLVLFLLTVASDFNINLDVITIVDHYQELQLYQRKIKFLLRQMIV